MCLLRGVFPLALSADSPTNYFARGFPQIIGTRTGLGFADTLQRSRISQQRGDRAFHFGEACSPEKSRSSRHNESRACSWHCRRTAPTLATLLKPAQSRPKFYRIQCSGPEGSRDQMKNPAGRTCTERSLLSTSACKFDWSRFEPSRSSPYRSKVARDQPATLAT